MIYHSIHMNKYIVEAPPHRDAQYVSAQNPPMAFVYIGGFLTSLSLHLNQYTCFSIRTVVILININVKDFHFEAACSLLTYIVDNG